MLNKYPALDMAYLKFIQDNNLTSRKVVLKKYFSQNAANLLMRSASGANHPSMKSSNSLNHPESPEYLEEQQFAR